MRCAECRGPASQRTFGVDQAHTNMRCVGGFWPARQRKFVGSVSRRLAADQSGVDGEAAGLARAQVVPRVPAGRVAYSAAPQGWRTGTDV